MKIHPPSPTPSTRPSKGLELLVLALETGPKTTRLVCYGAPFDGARLVKEWHFDSSQPANALLDEIGATVEDVAITALLRAIGWPQRLPLVATQPTDPPKPPTGPYEAL